MVLDEIQRVDIDDIPDHVQRLYARASLVALFGNLFLLVAKAVVAHVSGSTAVYADAANSASDVVYCLFMGVGLWLSLQPADSSHPHGHRRIEPLVSMGIGLAMSLAGFEAARMGIRAWQAGPSQLSSSWAFAAILITAAIKAVMYVVTLRIARRTGSPALQASATDNLADVLASGMAFVGVGLNRLGFLGADPLAGLCVAVWILYGAAQVLIVSVRQCIGGAPPPELSEAILDRARQVAGVLAVHQVIVEYVGPQVRADIHINMDGRLSLDEVHRVSDRVRETVEALEQVDHAFVHVEPMER